MKTLPQSLLRELLLPWLPSVGLWQWTDARAPSAPTFSTFAIVRPNLIPGSPGVCVCISTDNGLNSLPVALTFHAIMEGAIQTEIRLELVDDLQADQENGKNRPRTIWQMTHTRAKAGGVASEL